MDVFRRLKPIHIYFLNKTLQNEIILYSKKNLKEVLLFFLRQKLVTYLLYRNALLSEGILYITLVHRCSQWMR